MKKKRHIIRLQGKGGWARRVVVANAPTEYYWIALTIDKRWWSFDMAGALKFLKDNGVTDIKRITGMSL